MVYEWDEEVPQPKPPTRHCRLLVEHSSGSAGGTRDATQADIARALGLTEVQLADFLAGRIVKLPGVPVGTCGQANAYTQQSALNGDVIYGPGGRKGGIDQ